MSDTNAHPEVDTAGQLPDDPAVWDELAEWGNACYEAGVDPTTGEPTH